MSIHFYHLWYYLALALCFCELVIFHPDPTFYGQTLPLLLGLLVFHDI